MQVLIKGIEEDIFVNTVTLHKNTDNVLSTLLMHCYKCASNITQVQGIIGAISAGYLPSDEVATITRCYKCGENYTFQTLSGKSDKIKLTVSYDKGVETLHCIICRKPQLQYNDKGAATLPEFLVIKLPFTFSCGYCIQQPKYLLEEIVSRVL